MVSEGSLKVVARVAIGTSVVMKAECTIGGHGYKILVTQYWPPKH